VYSQSVGISSLGQSCRKYLVSGAGGLTFAGIGGEPPVAVIFPFASLTTILADIEIDSKRVTAIFLGL
jgi:hypothetical protein